MAKVYDNTGALDEVSIVGGIPNEVANVGADQDAIHGKDSSAAMNNSAVIIHAVTALKKLFVTEMVIFNNNYSAGAGDLTIRDNATNKLFTYAMYQKYIKLTFSPPLEIAHSLVTFSSQAMTCGIIWTGWEEDA